MAAGLQDSEQQMTFTDADSADLASQRLGRLATIGPDGSPQVKPVGFRHNPGWARST